MNDETLQCAATLRNFTLCLYIWFECV